MFGRLFGGRYAASDGTHPRNVEQTKLSYFRISTIQLARLSDGALLDQYETMVFPLKGFTAFEHMRSETEKEAKEQHAYLVARYRQLDREMARRATARRTTSRRWTCRSARTGRFTRC